MPPRSSASAAAAAPAAADDEGENLGGLPTLEDVINGFVLPSGGGFNRGLGFVLGGRRAPVHCHPCSRLQCAVLRHDLFLQSNNVTICLPGRAA